MRFRQIAIDNDMVEESELGTGFNCYPTLFRILEGDIMQTKI